jgi:hypothetical protein
MGMKLISCGKCNGQLVLAYDGWSCYQCGRKYLLRNGVAQEMWWKNEGIQQRAS